MRRSPANRSVAAPASPDTRAMMVPTVRQEIRISWVIVVFDHAVLGAGHPRRGGLQLGPHRAQVQRPPPAPAFPLVIAGALLPADAALVREPLVDRKSTRLNSSHSSISYAVF